MATWQIVVLVVAVLLPLLLLGQHPARERLSARGVPMDRQWRPAPRLPVDDDH